MRPPITDLLEKYLTSSLSEKEEAQFISILHDETHRSELEKLIDGYALNKSLLGPADQQLMASSFDRLKTALRQKESLISGTEGAQPHAISTLNTDGNDDYKSLPAEVPVVRHLPFFKAPWVRYAAAILLILGAAVYFRGPFSRKIPQRASITSSVIKNDVAPGGNNATLTLADGSQIVLNDVASGELAEQAGSTVNKLDDGSIAYDPAGSTEGPVLYNTMSTPRGGQYRLTLADGTNVWLNAASSITFPTAFSGAERRVNVSGEAYFEVVTDKEKPFVVEAGEQEIRVLGTSFNINTYDDEDYRANTLLTGSIRLTTPGETITLKPGEQAIKKRDGSEKLRIRSVNVSAVVAWKNGLFDFENAQLKDAMKHLSRWYDVEVKYEDEPPVIVLAGEMQRSLNLSQVLNFLEKLGIRYRLEGRTLTISKR